MTARSVYEAVAATAHSAAHLGGVTPNTGATVAPLNSGTWSRLSANQALQTGQITQSQFVSVMQFLCLYEQVQIQNAKDVLRGTGDNAPA